METCWIGWLCTSWVLYSLVYFLCTFVVCFVGLTSRDSVDSTWSAGCYQRTTNLLDNDCIVVTADCFDLWLLFTLNLGYVDGETARWTCILEPLLTGTTDSSVLSTNSVLSVSWALQHHPALLWLFTAILAPFINDLPRPTVYRLLTVL